MSTNYKPSGSPQSAPGAGYATQAWMEASANAHALWASVIAGYPAVDAFLSSQTTNEAVKYFQSLILNVTQADCDQAGCSSEFSFFNGITNWVTSLANMKAHPYQP
jgi:hypothetical protein